MLSGSRDFSESEENNRPHRTRRRKERVLIQVRLHIALYNVDSDVEKR